LRLSGSPAQLPDATSLYSKRSAEPRSTSANDTLVAPIRASGLALADQPLKSPATAGTDVPFQTKAAQVPRRSGNPSAVARFAAIAASKRDRAVFMSYLSRPRRDSVRRPPAGATAGSSGR